MTTRQKTCFLYQSTPTMSKLCLMVESIGPTGYRVRKCFGQYPHPRRSHRTWHQLPVQCHVATFVQKMTAKSCMFCTSRIDLVICRNLKYPAHILACKHCMCCTESGDADVTQHTPIMKEKMYIIAPPSVSCVATMYVHLF